MAKQTFVTGQVLTASQMTSLQETALGGGPATAKTANYVLVASDAGTTVAMNAAGATTITVNTGLFAAGDTVFIQNLGAGACTITAGTATVATAGSLILPQNDAGILYFTSASASVFYDYVQPGITSPVTTKGDLYSFTTTDARLAVGANNTFLIADSTQSTGLAWSAGTYTSYTPANFTGFTLGNGTISGRHRRFGKTVFFSIVATLGSTSAVTGQLVFQFPISSNTANNGQTFGLGRFTDTGVGNYSAALSQSGTNFFTVLAKDSSGTYLFESTNTSSTIPFTWTTGDVIYIMGTYEAA